MKTNAIVRIVAYSLLALVLTGILFSALCGHSVIFNFRGMSGTEVGNEASVDAEITKNIRINWAGGNVLIQKRDVNSIIFRETCDKTIKKPMTYTWDDGTLTLNHSRASVSFGINNPPKKDLVVTVPLDWKCEELEINGAALDIMLVDLSVGELKLDGAAMNLSVTGYVYEMSVDGAGCTIYLDTSYITKNISMDGAGCKLTLLLPQNCGFRVAMDGLGCSFDSDVESVRSNGEYFYGDSMCSVEVDGLGCHVGIYYSEYFPPVSQ